MTHPTSLTTSRLVLRPPRPDDAAFHHALHSDPATYTHAPWAVVEDPTRNRVGLQTWLEGWESDGFGYWIAVDRETGERIGVAGVRPSPLGLNLYYRFLPGLHGSGLGREAARAATSWATEWLPGQRVVAVVRPVNEASARTALRAGLSHVGQHQADGDPADADPSDLYVAPTVGREHPADGLHDGMLDLWESVVRAGGSVGFRKDAPRADIARRLDDELGRTSDDAPLVTCRDAADGRLLGFCWWVRDPFDLFAHSAVLKRVMVDPAQQGRNLGSLLLSGAHAVARDMPGTDLLRLDYRSGSGLGTFYARHGWTEVGRVPGLIRVGPGDDHDCVLMARTPSGEPLRGDGRL